MKILQVNCVYGKGSTGKIVSCVHTELNKLGVDSIVCYGRGEKISEPNVYKTCGELYSKINNLLTRFTGIMYGGCRVSTNRLISIIQREQPDIVHLHCINGYFVNIYRLIRWLKENHIKTVLTLHAEFMYTANCGYAFDCEKWKMGCGHCPRCKAETKSLFFDGTARSWRKMKEAFDGFEQDCIITAVSPWLMERAKESPILRNFRHETVLNGLDTVRTFCPHSADGLRKDFGWGDRPLVLYVTPSFSLEKSHIKGGWYVVELAKRMPDTIFLIIGNRTPIGDLPENVQDIGRLENQQELARYYSAANITLLTSKKETFSMVTAESLCCGTPVVGFKAGAPEQIALPEYSEFVEYGDLDALETAVRDWNGKNIRCDEITAQAREKYSAEEMCSRYCEVYSQLGCE